ncbi:transporter substrate-binding domain-containing protein, partial [Poseidonibacter sp.]|uniref:transporter substrate-binding domain-containing protein n=1 Tax=Poseidonibacter sp. TaxID=2321188 RepID=UPI003C774BBE
MLKKFFFLFFIILASLVFANQKSFLVSYDPDYAPFSYKQNNKANGLLIDIWELWAKQNNYKVTFVSGKTWDNSLNLVKNNKVDFFLGTKSYEEWMIPSIAFYQTKSTFFSLRQNNQNITKDSKFTIGIIGSDYDILLKEKYPFAKIKIFKTYESSIKALTSNKIDFIYDDKSAIEFYILENKYFHLIKSNDFLIIKNDIEAIANNQVNADIFTKGFKNIPLEKLIELENRWIFDKKNLTYLEQKKNINLTKEEQEFLKKNIFKISISTDWKPFSFLSKSNSASGISTEYWELIANKLNISYTNSFSDTFNKQLQNIQKKEDDLIYSIGHTKEREKYSLFTKPYASFPLSIVTLKDENFIEDASALLNKKVAVGKNFTAHMLLKEKYPNMNFILVNSIEEGLNYVEDKKAYAFVDIKPVLLYNINKLGFNDLKITGNTGINYDLRFMIRNDYILLHSILNKAIDSISQKEVVNIIDKWNNIHFEKSFDYTLFWQILFVIILILLGFINRTLTLNRLNKTLKDTVEEKTKELNALNKNLEKRVIKKTNELIKKENILAQQSKMAAMGEMIENIAHQWRQPLSVISTAATGAKLQKSLGILDDKNFADTMDSINNSAQHLSATIDDFRTFFHQDKEEKSFKVKIPIEKTLSLLESKFKNRNIEIIKDIEDLSVLGLQNEFIQVIMNILNNAIDAFEAKDLDKKVIFINVLKENKNVVIKIKDNAGGVEDKIKDKIFD